MKFGYEYGIILCGPRAEPFVANQTSFVTLHHQPSVWRWPVAAAISIACSMRWHVTASSKVGQTCVPERQSRAKRTYAWARLEPGPCCVRSEERRVGKECRS